MFMLFIHCAVLIFIFMNLLFALSIYKKDNSIVDIGWGIGFMLIALYTFFAFSHNVHRQFLITLLTLIWGTRISTHIYMRNKGKGEDPRYERWRIAWGNSFLIRSYMQVFMLQGLAMLIIATPIIFVNHASAQGLGFLDLIGFVTWFVGFFFETVADYQLYIFLQDPANRGMIMMQGLWRYSRHPNYFGETLIWWGMFFIACNVHFGWLSIISPLIISYLLLFVSGVPLAEKQMTGLAQFAEYKRKTSIFVPWFGTK